ncbi:MAG: HlyD family secretion protein [Polyangiaceae bacterium]|nr:HlyD family secretion protein [Polyangiaceae bacterium]
MDTLKEAQRAPEPAVAAPTERAPAEKRSKLPVILGIVAIVGATAGGYVWSRRGMVSTDDAQIDAQVVSVPAQSGGTVTKVLFEENQEVHAGDLLVELDDAAPKARVAAAKATLAAAEAAAHAADADVAVTETNATGNRDVAKAALTTASAGAASASDQIKEAEAEVASTTATFKQAQQDSERAKGLVDAGAISKAEAERADTALSLASSRVEAAKARVKTMKLGAAQAQGRVAEASARAEQSSNVDNIRSQAVARAEASKAQVDSAQAALALAEIDLEHTKIRAPSDGVLSKKSVAIGQFVSPGQPVVQLVPKEVWVTANFKETQLVGLKLGQPVEIDVDAYGGAAFEGELESFSGATGSRFALLPPDNASGNFTKVVQRVPVRIRVKSGPEALALRPGMSVEVTVNTR